MKVLSPVESTVRGLAIWGENVRGPFWIEPFFASLRISEVSGTIAGYDLGFGDAVPGLGTVPVRFPSGNVSSDNLPTRTAPPARESSLASLLHFRQNLFNEL